MAKTSSRNERFREIYTLTTGNPQIVPVPLFSLLVLMALYTGGKVILVVAGRVAILHISLRDIARRGHRQGMYVVALVARGDPVGMVRYINVWIHLLALVRDVGRCALREPLKGAMAAEAEFGLRLFRQRRDGSFPFCCNMTEQAQVDSQTHGQKRRHGQATE